MTKHKTLARSRGVAGAVLFVPLMAIGLGVAATTGAGAAGTRPQANPTACTTATIAGFAFRPIKVPKGSNAQLYIELRNCSATRTFVGSLQTSGVICAVIDPLRTPVKLPPNTSQKSTQLYATSCIGKGFILGTLLDAKSKQISRREANVAVMPPSG